MRHRGQPTALPLRGAFWLCVYVTLVIAPLGLLLLGERPRPGGFWWDFALALGYASLAMMGLQFALTARFRRATAPFGIDLIYYFHRYLASIAVALLVAHALILLLRFPATVGRIDFTAAPLYMSAGWVALFAFLVLVASSLWRKRLRLEYDRWRRVHVVLAVLGLVASFVHVLGSGSYLEVEWKYALWIALGAFWLGLVLYVRLLRPVALMRRPWKVIEVRPERGRSWTLALEPEESRGFDYRAGQFVWLSLRATPFGMREHPFSIASSPSRPGRLEFTIKELGDFTRTISQIQPGERAWVDGPYGNFGVEGHEDAPGLVFIAGGVGIAPVISLLRWLADQGEQRPLWLFYGNRTFDRIVFREELEALQQVLSLKLVHVLGDPPEGWVGERGFITAEVLNRHLPGQRDRLHCFVCGPEPMIRLSERSLESLGVPLSRLHSEIFDLA
ncbi:ferric reductase-like transmembrane domain-containing protein [Aquimonas sp.]|jgi:predicted ferric reductase|uniref:ferredoxin reductase family protein n=1 Tax=Aquimonas sp. TaxID=1872588 RepID=UPI0037BF5A92